MIKFDFSSPSRHREDYVARLGLFSVPIEKSREIPFTESDLAQLEQIYKEAEGDPSKFAQIAKNLWGDVKSIRYMLPGLYYLAKGLVAQPTETAKELGKGMWETTKEEVVHPVKSFEEHPLWTSLDYLLNLSAAAGVAAAPFTAGGSLLESAGATGARQILATLARRAISQGAKEALETGARKIAEEGGRLALEQGARKAIEQGARTIAELGGREVPQLGLGLRALGKASDIALQTAKPLKEVGEGLKFVQKALTPETYIQKAKSALIQRAESLPPEVSLSQADVLTRIGETLRQREARKALRRTLIGESMSMMADIKRAEALSHKFLGKLSDTEKAYLKIMTEVPLDIIREKYPEVLTEFEKNSALRKAYEFLRDSSRAWATSEKLDPVIEERRLWKPFARDELAKKITSDPVIMRDVREMLEQEIKTQLKGTEIKPEELTALADEALRGMTGDDVLAYIHKYKPSQYDTLLNLAIDEFKKGHDGSNLVYHFNTPPQMIESGAHWYLRYLPRSLWSWTAKAGFRRWARLFPENIFNPEADFNIRQMMHSQEQARIRVAENLKNIPGAKLWVPGEKVAPLTEKTVSLPIQKMVPGAEVRLPYGMFETPEPHWTTLRRRRVMGEREVYIMPAIEEIQAGLRRAFYEKFAPNLIGKSAEEIAHDLPALAMTMGEDALSSILGKAWNELTDSLAYLKATAPDIFEDTVDALRAELGSQVDYVIGAANNKLKNITKETLDMWAKKYPIYVVPRAAYEEMTRTARLTGRTALAIWDLPTSAWRNFVLGLSPRWLLNNMFGNVLLSIIQGMLSPSGMQAFKESLRRASPEFRERVLRGEILIPGIEPGTLMGRIKTRLLPKYGAEGFAEIGLPAQVMTGFFGTESPIPSSIGRALGKGKYPFEDIKTVEVPVGTGEAQKAIKVARPKQPIEVAYPKLAGLFNFIKAPMAPFNEKVEGFFRKAMYLHEGIKEAKIQAAKEAGKRFFFLNNVVERKLKDVLESPELQKQAIDAVGDFLFNYWDLSNAEKNYIRRFLFPFWSWYKNVFRLVFWTLPAKYPAREALMYKLVQFGKEKWEDELKNMGADLDTLPDWLKGSFPIGFETAKDGTKQIVFLNTRGPNPFNIISEPDLINSLHPAWKIAFERFLHRDLFKDKDFDSPLVAEIQGKKYTYDPQTHKIKIVKGVNPPLSEHILRQIPQYNLLHQTIMQLKYGTVPYEWTAMPGVPRIYRETGEFRYPKNLAEQYAKMFGISASRIPITPPKEMSRTQKAVLRKLYKQLSEATVAKGLGRDILSIRMMPGESEEKGEVE